MAGRGWRRLPAIEASIPRDPIFPLSLISARISCARISLGASALLRWSALSLSALILAGCPPEKPVGIDTGLPDSAADDSAADDSATDDSEAPVDRDGDGSIDSEDCAPDDPGVHPAATEICDGVDQDCDGATDDGLLQVLYADTDGDGFGSGDAIESCPGAGWVEASGDCDDADAAVNPGVAEVCDGADQDCDGESDEGLTGTVYTDADGDGYGTGAGAEGCLDQPGWAQVDGDCDDGDFFVYPGQLEQCDGVDNDCNGQIDDDTPYVDWYADADGDSYGDDGAVITDCLQPAGYILVAGDCDDSDSAIRPGAAEACDEIDNDCDAQIDEGVESTYWRDADGDGWGDVTNATTGCSAPAGFVSQSGDCNDGDRGQYPGLTESCDGLDNDCSGAADDIFVTRYADGDGDSYGDATVSGSFSACSTSSGYVDDATDCRDDDSTIYPGAAEFCNAEDDDCDGAIDDGVTTTFYLDADSDSYGDPSSTAQDCAVPSGYARLGDDCDDLNSRINPSASEVCNFADDDCDGQLDEVDSDGDGWSACADDCDDGDDTVNPGMTEVCYDGLDNDCDGTANGCPLASMIDTFSTTYISGQGTGTISAQVGYSVAAVPDSDGDGDDEVIVGAPGVLGSQGAAYLMEGPASGSGSISGADATWVGSVNEAGYSVNAATWDDGSSQLLISSNGDDGYIIDASNRLSGTLASAAHTTLTVSGASDLCCRMEAGDLDGDGATDLLVAADADDVSGADSGRIYLAYGPISGALDLSASAQVAQLLGHSSRDRAGRFEIVPDMDGDGMSELLVGAWSADGTNGSDSGAAYLILNADLPAAGGTLDLTLASSATYSDTVSNSRVGWSVCGADLDGDGTSDLVIGAPGTGSGSGASGSNVYVIDGATAAGGTVLSSYYAHFDDTNTNLLGMQVRCSDLDADGTADLAFSDPLKDFSGRSSAGAVYVSYGPLSSGSCPLSTSTGCVDAIIGGARSGDNFGYDLDIGDVDGDGFGDLLIGAPETGSSAGTVYVLPNVSLQ